MYEQGQGVTQDHLEAYVWFSIAASKSNDEEYVKMRDETARELLPEQLAEAQKRASEWVPKHAAPETNEENIAQHPAQTQAPEKAAATADNAAEDKQAAAQADLASLQTKAKQGAAPAQPELDVLNASGQGVPQGSGQTSAPINTKSPDAQAKPAEMPTAGAQKAPVGDDIQLMDNKINTFLAADIEMLFRDEEKMNDCAALIQEIRPQGLSEDNLTPARTLFSLQTDRLRTRAECLGVSESYINERMEPSEEGTDDAEVSRAAFYASAQSDDQTKSLATNNCKAFLSSAQPALDQIQKGSSELDSKTCDYPKPKKPTHADRRSNITPTNSSIPSSDDQHQNLQKAFGNVFREFGLPVPPMAGNQ
jgi:hypothetical protein